MKNDRKMNYQILQEKFAEEEQANKKEKPMFEQYESADTESKQGNFGLTRLQGYIIIGIAVIILILLGLQSVSSFRTPKFAYKVLSVQAQFSQAASKNPETNSTTVGIKDEDLNILGKDGWELVGTFLEMETTHPNYGSSEYVTGLQPNIRPQKAVMIFRKPL